MKSVKLDSFDRMNIDDAIAHCEKVADEYKERAEEAEELSDLLDENMVANCKACAEEHKQLAMWLHELKTWRTWYEVMQKIISHRAM